MQARRRAQSRAPGRTGPEVITLNADRHASEACIASIKQFEAFRAHAYRDAVGIWTIGYGWAQGVKPGDTMTEAEADQRLRQYIAQSIEPDLRRDVRVALTQGQFDALVDLEYNLGTSKLDASTLLRKLNAGDYKGAAAEFPRWVHAGDLILAGLVHRRIVERGWFVGTEDAAA